MLEDAVDPAGAPTAPSTDKLYQSVAKKEKLPRIRVDSMEDEAWNLLLESIVCYCGNPVGTVAANDWSSTSILNYDQSWEKTMGCHRTGQGSMPASLKGYSCTPMVFQNLLSGFSSSVWTAVSYQLKDVQKLSPSAFQFVFSIAFFPWSIKQIYGILFVCIPIRGSAMVDDAMIAEAGRFERTKVAGDPQSKSWLARAFVRVCGSFFGGYAPSNLQIDTIFLLFAVLSSLQLISCGFVEENPVSTKVSAEVSDLASSQFKNGNSNSVYEDNFSINKLKIGTLRRKKSLKSSEKPTAISQSQGKDGSYLLHWFRS
ncbi:hypothetical protein Nepgr_012993 [Nepenthes gracilis]|uniref:Uncharacterized protein n=1 Tax=Nepenthes gracilis TaxID=150966 RepID=A0AAD3SH60_NEPGR|nr:hypothetical protein Nepgr_012993 [Nepenthes gracilis]